jgi:hypothetical protein
MSKETVELIATNTPLSEPFRLISDLKYHHHCDIVENLQSVFLHETINFKLIIPFGNKQCWILWQVIVNTAAIIRHSGQGEINDSHLQNKWKLFAMCDKMSYNVSMKVGHATTKPSPFFLSSHNHSSCTTVPTLFYFLRHILPCLVYAMIIHLAYSFLNS